MSKTCREICKNNTYLNDAAIDEVVKYVDLLPQIAESEGCDMFVDCLSKTGKSYIVVGEAKPKSVPSAYDQYLIGWPIRRKDEPAVTRVFQTGLPTSELLAISMPEEKKIVQSAFPIIVDEEVIGVLIYEKLFSEFVSDAKEIKNLEIKNESDLIDSSKTSILDYIKEGVLYIDKNNAVCYRNSTASQMFKRAGYVTDMIGKKIENFWYKQDGFNEERIMTIGDTALKGAYHDIDDESIKSVLIIQDISSEEILNKKEEILNLQYREYRHRIKNMLWFLYNVYIEKMQAATKIEYSKIYSEISNRINFIILALVNEQGYGGPIELKKYLSSICEDILKTEASNETKIELSIEGDLLYTKDEEAMLLGGVIVELMHNTLKYAYKGKPNGNINIKLKDDGICKNIIFEDHGNGFNIREASDENTGLKLIKSIIEERLDGVLTIASDDNGTRIEIEYIY